MVGFEEMAYAAAIHAGRMGERWQASAARMRIPAPRTAHPCRNRPGGDRIGAACRRRR